MGNEASRVDGAGLSPTALAGGRAASGSKIPTTPLSTPAAAAARRAQSFSGVVGTPRGAASSSAGSGGGTGGGASAANANANAGVERTIQRMDRAIRKRVRGGVTYNMRIAVRGARGTGKTSLFQRLKGEPIPETHEPTPQLQSATINWSFRAGSEESIKCEVWDVVDRGFDPLAPPATPAAAGGGAAEAEAGGRASSPFELGALQSNSNFASVRASAAVAASIAGASGASGSHTVATVDATTVDVYHETHGVVFLLDVTRWDTLEYVRQQLEKVPAHIPTLVLGNFRDCGSQRQVFKEDIQVLLYGSSDRSRQQQQQLRRPHELLYFECSLLNCYGLKSLHQYFGIPFLQLKLATIRQQMRIVEGEFSHVKNDLQAKISEQRYSDYVEHIKATGSDIRTGRKASSGPSLRHSESTIVVSGDSRSSESAGGDAESVRTSVANGDAQRPESAGGDASDSRGPKTAGGDAEPLNSSVANVSSPSAESPVGDAGESAGGDAEPVSTIVETGGLQRRKSASGDPLDLGGGEQVAQTPPSSAAAHENGSQPSVTAASIAEPMNLEDFQVPKQKSNDLDSFYSDNDSDADGGSDEDVIIPPSAALLAKKKTSHKQQFIYSDSSDSDDDRINRRAAKPKVSPRRGRKVVATAGKSAPTSAAADVPAVQPAPSRSMEHANVASTTVEQQQPQAPVASASSQPPPTIASTAPAAAAKDAPAAQRAPSRPMELASVSALAPPTPEEQQQPQVPVSPASLQPPPTVAQLPVSPASPQPPPTIASTAPSSAAADAQAAQPASALAPPTPDEQQPQTPVSPASLQPPSVAQAPLSPASPQPPPTVAPTAASGARRPKQRPELQISDDESDSSSGEPMLVALRPSLSVLQPRTVAPPPSRSPLSSRPTPASSRSELDAFFSESESESESESTSRAMFPAAPAGDKSALRTPKHHTVAGSDDEDEDEDEDGGRRGGSSAVDRFASYDTKLVRKSKAERRQEREEIRRMTSALGSARHLDAATTPAAATLADSVSADVLAAIRAAEEEALRMLPPSSDAGSDGGEEKRSKKKATKHKTSTRAKSSRSSAQPDNGDSSKRRSSSKSSTSTSSARSSRRREV